MISKVLRFAAFVLLTLFTQGVGAQVVEQSSVPCLSEKLQATLWVQTSLEYQAACRQAYRLAESKLIESLQTVHRSAAMEQGNEFALKPPAVILDVDETVLDNSPYNARLARQGASYTPETWAKWCHEGTARSVPGAKQFIHAAQRAGVTVFFVTNRDHALKRVTRENLVRVLGIPVSAEQLLLKNERPEWTSSKASRRAHVADRYRITLLVGDDVNDFVTLGRRTPEQRRDLAEHFAASWGHHWIMLPNPVYGSWEKSLYEYDFERSSAEKRKLLLDSLRTE